MDRSVIGVNAVSVAKISFSVDMISPGGKGSLEVRDLSMGFIAWIPKSVRSKIELGDRLIILCVPSDNLLMARETMAVAKVRKNGITEMIWSQSQFWSDLWSKTGSY